MPEPKASTFRIRNSMRHVILAGLFCGLAACAADKSKNIVLDAKAQQGLVELQAKKIAELQDELKTVKENLESQSKLALDVLAENTSLERDMCGNGQRPDGSLRYQVSTADSPEKALEAVSRIYRENNIETRDEAGNVRPIQVKNIKLDTGKGWPDIVCFEFGNQTTGEKITGKTCFDPMEITER